MLLFLATSSPFFAAIALGWLAGRFRLFGSEAVSILNTFAFVVATPAMVVRVMARQPLGELWNPPFFLGVVATSVALLGLAILFWRRAGHDFGPAVSRGQTLVGGNFAFLGIPLMLAFLGDGAAGPIAIGLVCDTAVIVPLCIGLIEAGRGSGSPGLVALRLVRGTLVNPFMLSILAGLAISLSGWPLPAPVDRFLVFVGGAAAPTGVFALGLALHGWMRKGGFLRVAPLAVAKLVVHPLAIWAVLALVLRLEPFWVAAGVLYAAVPVAANAFIIADRYETGSETVAAAVLVSTVLAAFTYPVAAWLVAP
ncbi:AEC family transporter [Alsobacter sp. SYSU M60028]|uniref:AEC family transporter n=1 Tax=Alsobacter ponti TaxID=2962936 RepID=A0ABT1LEB0_9HYPH|nr:AEC family transporter [Alsobacter ponti]MCP8939832.1 AEC family transporter [Alsobacter ponti]